MTQKNQAASWRSFLQSDDEGLPAPELYREIVAQSDMFRDVVGQLDPQIDRIASLGWFKTSKCIDLSGIGSSFNALEIAVGLCPDVCSCPQKSTKYHPVGDVLVVVSQSGKSTDTLRIVDQAKGRGMKLLAVTATEGSPLDERSDATLLLPLPEEKAIAATGSMTGTLLALYMLLSARAGKRDVVNADELANQVSGMIGAQSQAASPLERLVEALDASDYIVFLGDGAMEAVAHECSLKIRETSSVMAESNNAREYVHGFVEVLPSSELAKAGIRRTAVLIEPGLVDAKSTVEFYEENLYERHAGTPRAFRLLRVALGREDMPDDIPLPDVGPLTVIPAIILLGQLAGYELALRKSARKPGTSDTLLKYVVTDTPV